MVIKSTFALQALRKETPEQATTMITECWLGVVVCLKSVGNVDVEARLHLLHVQEQPNVQVDEIDDE